MASPTDPLRQRLEAFRPYLRLLARLHLGGDRQGKVDASDVIQQALLEALRCLDQFRGSTDGELAAWLRTILARQLAHARRDLGREKRDVSRERSLEQALAESSACLGAWLADSSPSPAERASADEQAVRLARAIEALPEAQRDAVVMHYWQGQTTAEVAEQMGRTRPAVAGLLQRGLKELRRLLQERE